MKVYIKTDTGVRRFIGEIENGVFTSLRKSSIHLYKALNAWGIDLKALEGMIAHQNLTVVKIRDIETGITYITNAENFKEHGTILHFKPHRTQIFLPLSYWETRKEG